MEEVATPVELLADAVPVSVGLTSRTNSNTEVGCNLTIVTINHSSIG